MSYRRGPIKIQVPIPPGYRQHLETLQEVLGEQRAPYFGPVMYYPNEAIQLWEGNRGMEEYAREAFPMEEAANGMTWMDDDDESVGNETQGDKDSRPSLESAEETRAEAEKNFTVSC